MCVCVCVCVVCVCVCVTVCVFTCVFFILSFSSIAHSPLMCHVLTFLCSFC